MKVALPKETGKKKEAPPLPLVSPEDDETDKLKIATFKLRTDPTNTDSPTYTFSIVKLDGSESLRQGLQFYNKASKVMSGLNITVGDNKLSMYREMLTGQALQQFNKGVTAYAKAMLEKARRARLATIKADGTITDEEAIKQELLLVAQPAVDDEHLVSGLTDMISHLHGASQGPSQAEALDAPLLPKASGYDDSCVLEPCHPHQRRRDSYPTSIRWRWTEALGG